MSGSAWRRMGWLWRHIGIFAPPAKAEIFGQGNDTNTLLARQDRE
ncbi:MAG: hypothetical protein U0232_06250 [Thermomicrobiales bacterium]